MGRILLVDDEPTILSVAGTLLRIQGHEIVAVSQSEEAARLLNAEDEIIDLMISDVRMSPVDGMELLGLSRKVRPDLPVVMVSAYYSAEAAKEFEGKGAFAFLKKPFDTKRLIEVATKAMERGRG